MIKLFWYSVVAVWKRPVDYDPYPMRDHHAAHIGLSVFAFLICLVCGASWEQSAYIVMGLGLIAEVAGLLSGETLRNAICDICQYWLFSPLVLLYYGNWILAVVWLGVLLFGYFWTLLK